MKLDKSAFRAKISALKSQQKSQASHLSDLIESEYHGVKQRSDALADILYEIERRVMSLYGKHAAMYEHLQDQYSSAERTVHIPSSGLKKQFLQLRNEKLSRLQEMMSRYQKECDQPMSEELSELLIQLKRSIEGQQ